MNLKEGINECADRLPSVFEIMKGIQNQEIINQTELHMIESKKHVKALIKNMLYVWNNIFKRTIHTDFNR